LDFSGVTLTGITAIRGQTAVDTIIGSAGNDTIVGAGADDNLSGGAGDDVFQYNGTAGGYDAVNGGTGNDTIQATAANTVIGLFSLTGVEAISSGGFAGVSVSTSAYSTTLDFSGVTLTGITAIRGQTAVDTIIGSAGNDTIVGAGADDNLSGGAGDDVFQYNGTAGGYDAVNGGTGNDTIQATAANTVIGLLSLTGVEAISSGGFAGVSVSTSAYSTTLDFSGVTLTGITAIRGQTAVDTIIGSAGNDTIFGGVANDNITGGAGDDTLNGDGDNDSFYYSGVSNGFDTINGGAGTDSILALSTNTVIGIASLSAVEAINANGFGGVRILGSTAANTLNFSAVTVTGIAAIDGGAGNDIITGSAGNDVLIGNAGNDTLNGGAGIDTVDYSYLTTGFTLNLAVTAAQTLATGDADTLSNIENIIGGVGADTLTGTATANTLNGGSGNDTITGGAGDDTIIGGLGSDTLLLSGLQASYSITTVNGSVRVVDNQPTVDGNDGTDTISSIETLRFRNGATVSITSPIILDLDGNGVRTVSAANSNARYDMDGDGLTDDTSWFGNTEGLLFLDRDGNGTLTNSGEFSFIDDVAGARSDLEGLRAFDSNSDGRLSNLDTRFNEFRIWQDRDGDGVAESGEILTLTQASVRSLNLTATAVNATTQLGDVAVVNRGSYTRTNGTTMEFLDAALTYFSSATNVPTIAVQQQSLSRKAGKYTITISNGAMTLAPRSSRGPIDARAGVLGASAMLSFKDQTIGMLSPIILDLDGDGIEMRSIKKAKASFDMNGDGIADDAGWVGKGDGFLVIDRNGDGLISHASELSFASEDADASSDLEALAALDNNNDGVLNANDARFSELKVWVDANGNGTTEAGELKTLAEVGISEINLRGRNIDGTAKVGDNVLISTSTFTRTNGTIGTLGNAALAYRPGTGAITGDVGRNGVPWQTVPENPEVEDGVIGSDEPVTAELNAALSALRRTPIGPDIARLFSDVPDNVDAFDYYSQVPDKLTPVMESPSVTESASLDTGALPMAKIAPVMEVPTTKTTPIIGNPIAKIAPIMEDPAANSKTGGGSAATVATDRLLAIIAQDMAAFGAKGGEDELNWRRDGVRPIDFYA
jgi:Ca2+-binding RTX toxin-like protein